MCYKQYMPFIAKKYKSINNWCTNGGTYTLLLNIYQCKSILCSAGASCKTGMQQ